MSGNSGGSHHRSMAEQNTILRVPTGSQLYGLNVPGTNDKDEIGVCLEPIKDVVGFTPFEQYEYRTASERSGQHDAPSQPGDLDLTIYGLRKFLRLALKGNPQIIQCLFVPGNLCLYRNDVGVTLQDMSPFIVSRQCGKHYLGYLEAQRQRLLGERGQLKVHRPELVAKHGHDTKYLMHVVRLAFQGVELLSTGALTLPMEEESRRYAYAVRLGEVTLQDALTKVGELEQELKDLIHTAPIEDQPNRAVLEDWMVQCYREAWYNDTQTT
jgi:predicted nucleotidyltransferase